MCLMTFLHFHQMRWCFRGNLRHCLVACRYSYFELPDVVIAAEAPYVDASSYNGYVWWPGQKITAIVSHIHAITNKPVVISEYGFRANNNTSGDPNWIGVLSCLQHSKLVCCCGVGT